jgi:hypothetical protein
MAPEILLIRADSNVGVRYDVQSFELHMLVLECVSRHRDVLVDLPQRHADFADRGTQPAFAARRTEPQTS